MATSSRVSPMSSSQAQRASATVSNTPAAIHSSRLARTVVSEDLLPQSRSASSHEQPVTNRTSITSKQSRSGSRRRWEPGGWVFGAGGTRGSIAAQTVPTTSGSGARMVVGYLHEVVGSAYAHHFGAATRSQFPDVTLSPDRFERKWRPFGTRPMSAYHSGGYGREDLARLRERIRPVLPFLR